MHFEPIRTSTYHMEDEMTSTSFSISERAHAQMTFLHRAKTCILLTKREVKMAG